MGGTIEIWFTRGDSATAVTVTVDYISFTIDYTANSNLTTVAVPGQAIDSTTFTNATNALTDNDSWATSTQETAGVDSILSPYNLDISGIPANSPVFGTYFVTQIKDASASPGQVSYTLLYFNNSNKVNAFWDYTTQTGEFLTTSYPATLLGNRIEQMVGASTALGLSCRYFTRPGTTGAHTRSVDYVLPYIVYSSFANEMGKVQANLVTTGISETYVPAIIETGKVQTVLAVTTERDIRTLPRTDGALPSYVSAGTLETSSAGITVGAPSSYANGDLLFLVLASAGGAFSSPGVDWTQVSDSPQTIGTADAAGGIRIALYWKIASGTQSAVSISDAGDYTQGQMFAFHGVSNSSPINASDGTTEASGTSTVEFAELTTSVANCMVLYVVGIDDDANDTTNISGWTNSNLTNIQELQDQSVSTGDGGGFALAYGTLAPSGAIGAGSATADSTNNRIMYAVALAPGTTTSYWEWEELLQPILATVTELDSKVFIESERIQTILSTMGRTETYGHNEVGRQVTALVVSTALAGLDFSEAGITQVIKCLSSVSDGFLLQEILNQILLVSLTASSNVEANEAKSNTILAVTEATNIMTLTEIVLQVLKALSTESDTVNINETAIQTILSVITQSGALTMNESLAQTILFTIEEYDNHNIGGGVTYEEAVDQIVLAITEASDECSVNEALELILSIITGIATETILGQEIRELMIKVVSTQRDVFWSRDNKIDHLTTDTPNVDWETAIINYATYEETMIHEGLAYGFASETVLARRGYTWIVFENTGDNYVELVTAMSMPESYGATSMVEVYEGVTASDTPYPVYNFQRYDGTVSDIVVMTPAVVSGGIPLPFTTVNLGHVPTNSEGRIGKSLKCLRIKPHVKYGVLITNMSYAVGDETFKTNLVFMEHREVD